MAKINDGDTICKKMGRSGGAFEDRGIVKTNVATRRQISISPRLAETASSAQSRCKNFVGGMILMQRSTSNAGPFPARANASAPRMACLGSSSHARWLFAGKVTDGSYNASDGREIINVASIITFIPEFQGFRDDTSYGANVDAWH